MFIYTIRLGYIMKNTINKNQLSKFQLFSKHGMFSLFVAMMISFHSTVFAAASPTEVLEKASHEMIDAINKNRDAIKLDPDLTQTLVEEILLPQIDLIAASKAVMGKYWDEATKEQKITFIRQFKTLLLRFYSSALSEYLNSHEVALDYSMMTFFQSTDEANANTIVVRSEVKVSGEKPVPIVYYMRNSRKGWRIFDVAVEGVSLITTYKTSFGSEMAADGIDAMLESLAARNRRLLSGDNSALTVNNQ